MKSTIRKMGNSHGVIIPKPLLMEIGAKANDPVDLRIKKGRLVIEPIKRKPRAEWGEASRKIAEAGDGGLAWPEFANKADEDMKW
jgi:antitoxin MazE